ncbi:MBL fold metallo-hydrolase [Candidatus Poribacteria bacterium]|nr:MBL fold metallo-hydrolase [Candidatus Poribacteria bacterium]
MKITFIGVSSCIPDRGMDTACFVINGRHLVDTGWGAVLKMREYGIDPLEIRSVILTHLHQDHYIGLPQFLFYRALRGRRRTDLAPLHVIGPQEHLARVLKAALDFLQISRFPELKEEYTLMPLNPGEDFELDGLHFETRAARHVSGEGVPEQALAYKVVERAGGSGFVFTGDTSFHPPIAEFAKGMQLLIHDAAHTSARDAAMIAKMAGVERLFLIHYSQEQADRLLTEAREVFPDTFLAREGETLMLAGERG